MSHDEIVDRFVAVAEPALGRARAAEAVDRIARLERLTNVRELTELLRIP